MKDWKKVKDIAYQYYCNPETLKVKISREKDWFAMYYEEKDSI
jgi:hypothetical protein